MNKLTYSVKEASELTGLHQITIHRALMANKIRSKLVGRRRLIDARSLHEYLGVEPDREEA
ncbi:excisionase family DNA-binding protein [Erythrobacter sp. YJ-T3-07]|uniref:excisionase family DNA-binding protein n=1 Tax=Erythrobacter sp. YJ-T3-07 TaxID=2793063 RepID=UPI0018D398C0|nr:excisionase family DNA-binding protein [Erythrobacter sp. YJ-T3-07]MBH1944427.1 excisionase family DNA-binding protein [Erythrobacter sp. YJ-T3-07]